MTTSAGLRDVRICVFGDSFVAGVGDPKALGWVGRVARTPPSTGVALTVYPLGVRGQTTEDIVVRMPLECLRACRGDEHGVVLAVGVADAFTDFPVARSVATLEFGLQSMQARRLVVGPPPVGPAETRPDRRAGRRLRLALPAHRRAVHLDVPSAGRTPPWSAQNFADGLHPAQAGYGMLADVVLTGGWYEWLGVQRPDSSTVRRHDLRA